MRFYASFHYATNDKFEVAMTEIPHSAKLHSERP